MKDAQIRGSDFIDAGDQVRRFREMFVQSPSFSALLQGREHRFVLINPAYQQLIGHRDVIGLTVGEAIPEVERQGFIGLLDSVFATGEAYVGKDVEVILQRLASNPRREALSRFCHPANRPTNTLPQVRFGRSGH